MASYRFCRSDDVALLVDAHNACCTTGARGARPLTVDAFKQAAREIDLWTSSCMVATEGATPIAVLLACKREGATLVWRVGVHPEQRRRGHGRHLLTSLSAKLAILGPPGMVAEVPAARAGCGALLEASGWTRETDYTDFVIRSPFGRMSDLVIPITVDELLANEALEPRVRGPWEQAPATLAARKDSLQGLAVASESRIEAWLLHDPVRKGRDCRVRALGCADPARLELWLGLLVAQLASAAPAAIRLERLCAADVPFEILRALGFDPDGVTTRYVSVPRPA